jgi:hypothetical protein
MYFTGCIINRGLKNAKWYAPYLRELYKRRLEAGPESEQHPSELGCWYLFLFYSEGIHQKNICVILQITNKAKIKCQRLNEIQPTIKNNPCTQGIVTTPTTY